MINLAVWSGPRNISTALMYSFGNRDDFNQKIDELNQETEILIDEIEKWQT